MGKDKRSLAMVLPSELIRSLNIDPLTILFLLKVEGHDELQLRIVRQEHLEKKEMENVVPADNDPNPTQQVSSTIEQEADHH